MMTGWDFTEPSRLLLLVAIPASVLMYRSYWRRRQPIIVVSQLPVGGYAKSSLFSPDDVFFSLRMAALFFLILALAKPTTVQKEKFRVPAADVDIVLSLDVSGSMLIEDIKPNRLEALKEVITNFTAARSHDRFGLVLYAGESVVWSPLTKDSRFLLNKIGQINNKEMADGTAIGLGLASALNTIKSSKAKNKIVILLTDGENNTGFIHPLTAAAIAAKYHVKVYTIGIGTTGKAPMPITDFDGNKSYQYIDVKLDEPLLKSIARQTGGSYFRATDSKALKNIYTQINNLEKTKGTVQFRDRSVPQYRVFAGLALVFVMMELLLNITLLKTFN